MIKKYSLVVVVFLCFVLSGFGQATLPTARTAWNSTPIGWTDTPLDSYTTTFACSGSNGAKFDTTTDLKIINFDSAPSELTFVVKSNATTTSALLVEESADGASYSTVVSLSGTGDLPTTCTTKGPYTLNSASRYVKWTFTKGSQNMTMDDVSITKLATNTVDFCNLQSPATGNTTVGTVYNVYAQVYEAGVTEAAGQGAGITGWIGYNTVNNNPNTAGWTWKAATFNVQSGNNDEYVANLGTLPTLASGTYYYASRFQIDGGPYRYGGLGGFWNLTARPSGVLSVDTVDYCSLEYPATGAITLGDAFAVYGQVYEQGVTPGVGQGLGIEAEIGYSSTNTNPNTWTNWIPTTYNAACLDCNDVAGVIQNDEYSGDLGTAITSPGTYYYATRFRLNSGAWLYGGILADESAGGFWNNSPYISGVLTVANVPQCHTEDFTAIPANNSAYNTRTWTGTGGIWTATDARTDQTITGRAITVRNGVLTSPEFTDGIGSLTVTTQTKFSTNSGTFTLKVNGVTKGSIPYSGTATTTTISGINVPYEIIVTLENNDGERVAIDDLSWTCYECPSPAADPTGTIAGDTPECNTTELTYSAPSATTFWQTTANGHSTANPTTTPLEVTTSGTYYVNTFNGTCWSLNSVAYPVVINYSAIIATQPVDQLATVGDTVNFSVTATNVTSYQWQESADGITWTNVGTNSNTLTLTNVQLSRNGYRYRVALNSATCGILVSDIATLLIYTSNCLNEVFPSATLPVGWGGTSTNDTDPTHYQSGPNARTLAANRNIITPAVDNPEVLRFYQDASAGGNGQIATVDYRIGAGAYVQFYSFAVTQAGRVETVSLNNLSGVDLRTQTNVTFRFRSTFSTWYLDDVKVFCTPCTNTAAAATALPTSGPIGTYVTINGSDFTALTTVKFNGITATIDSWTATQLVVIVPAGARDGDILISTTGFCDTALAFDIIDNDQTACQSNFTGTDLFIYEIFDEDNAANGPPIDYGNGGMITIINPTLQTVNLSDYKLYRSSTVGSTPYEVWFSPTGTLAPGALYRIRVTASQCTGYVAPYNDVIIGFNTDDGFELRKLNSGNNTYESIDQALTPNYTGYYMLRDLNALNPSTTYTPGNWAVTNIYNPPSNTTTCVSVGITPAFSGSLPIINSFVAPTSSCDTASITINATEGYNQTSPADAKQLNFEWYYYNGVTDVWTLITNGGDYTITNTINNGTGIGASTLDVANVYAKVDYQFYCRVRENDATCYVASNAIKLNVARTVWNGTVWTPNAPDISTIAIIDGDYDMSVTGANEPSFSACQLVVNTDMLLTIEDNKFVEVENNVTVNGSINLKSKGSFVQNNDAGLVDGAVLTTRNKIVVEKMTALMNRWYEYTYWSSPVSGETAGTAFAESNASRRFWYNGANFLDETRETGNNNATVDGQDDIDDNADDWTLAPAGMTLLPGVGYASTLSSTGFIGPNRSYQFTFEGPFNNGIVTVPIYRNDFELADNNWNFIGNPYPSAISADRFLAANTNFDLNGPGGPMAGALFLWSQNTNASGSTNGNEAQNFAQSDFAIINGTGETAGGDGITPTRYIPSGQGFFVSMANAAPSTVVSGDIKRANVTFNNSMREKANNVQFFRTATDPNSNKLWLNLTSNNGAFSQILVGYVDGATDGDDGMYYDATKNLSTGAYSLLYSLIDNNTELKLGIQGKQPSSLTLDEVIPLGFYTSIQEPTTYKISKYDVEGEFLTTNAIYLKDNLLNITFDISVSDYIFSSEKGEFNTRFEIVFRAETLSVIDNEIPANGLTIIELPTGEVKFTVTNNLNITYVEIFDMLGRTVYRLTGDSSTEVYDISNLSQAAYMAKVTLSNGQVITKRAVKRY